MLQHVARDKIQFAGVMMEVPMNHLLPDIFLSWMNMVNWSQWMCIMNGDP